MVAVRVIDLTPEMANTFLEHNIKNRRLDNALVLQYADDMKNGRWHENGQPITMSNGIMVSGQHRCHAVIKSGITLKNVVVVYTDDAGMIDTGKVKSVKDLTGFISTKIAAAVNACYQMSSGIGCGAKISKAITIEKYNKWKKSCDFIDANFGNTSTGLCTAGITGACLAAHIVGYPKDKLTAFILAFQTGYMHSEEDITAIALRNASINSKKEGRAARTEMYLKTQCALQAYEQGRRVKQIRKLANPCYVPEV